MFYYYPEGQRCLCCLGLHGGILFLDDMQLGRSLFENYLLLISYRDKHCLQYPKTSPAILGTAWWHPVLARLKMDDMVTASLN